MVISSNSHRGFEYTIHLTGNSKFDWGVYTNKFYAVCDTLSIETEYHSDHDSAAVEIHTRINEILDTAPKTLDDLLNSLEDCLVWTGYEDCHFNKKKAKILIEAFLKGI